MSHMHWTINDNKLWWWRAICVNVVDGDTVDLIVDRGFRQLSDDRFRLIGIDTPETYRRTAGLTNEQWAIEKESGLKAKQRVETLILNKEVLIHTEINPDKYGRWLATVYYFDGDWKSLNQTLLNEGLAKPYLS